MKKYWIICLSVLCFLGCSGGDSANTSFLGTWRMEEEKGQHTILSLRNNGTFQVDLRVEGNLTKIIEKKGHVKAVEFIENELGECDESGRCRPIPVPDSTFELEADNVFLAIGQGPHLGFIEDEKVLIGEKNTVAADLLSTETGMKGVFAGGDCVTGPASVVDAIGAGKRAARAIDDYLKEEKDV